VKSGMRVRCNCNIFNLAMENVLKGLPDKISCPDIIPEGREVGEEKFVKWEKTDPP